MEGVGTAAMIMLIGMVGVIAFLTVLVLVIFAITRLSPPPGKKALTASSVPAKQDAETDLALVAVVQAVVAAYESEQQASTEGAR